VTESIPVYSPPLDTMYHYELHRRAGVRFARREPVVDV
jgi:hypothetical protein